MVMTPNLLLMMVAMMIVTVLLVAGVVLVEQCGKPEMVLTACNLRARYEVFLFTEQQCCLLCNR